MAKERPDAAHGGATFGRKLLHRAVCAANRATGDYFTRRRVRCLAEGANDGCTRELLMRARRGEAVVSALEEMINKGGTPGADAANMVRMLAKEGLDCTSTVSALEGRLYKGMEMEKSMAALALIQTGGEAALSALLLAYGSSDIKVRRAVDVAVCIEKATLEARAGRPELDTGGLNRKLLDRCAGGMEPGKC